MRDLGKFGQKMFLKQVIDECVEEADTHLTSNVQLMPSFSRQHCASDGFFETHRERTEQKANVNDLNYMLFKIALQYRFIIMSTTQ